jgi:(p)ppGpp synthase/HD superfamily hydrolase
MLKERNMNNGKSQLIERAIEIALKAHIGQVDKAGDPYILHPLRVMLAMRTETEQIAAVLHDVVEDSDWTLEALRLKGFPAQVIAAVDHLTRRKEEKTYEAFIRRAGQHPIARRVKLADLQDNMDIRRIRQLKDKDIKRLKKYHQAWLELCSSPG